MGAEHLTGIYLRLKLLYFVLFSIVPMQISADLPQVRKIYRCMPPGPAEASAAFPPKLSVYMLEDMVSIVHSWRSAGILAAQIPVL